VIRRLALAVVALVSLSAAGAATARLGAAAPSVVTYPSAQSVPPTGRLPPGSGHSLTFDEPVGGADTGQIVVTGAKQVGLTIDEKPLGPIAALPRFRHFVRFGSSLVPDALVPWDGSVRPVEQPNQPLSIDVEVPYGTKPGTYKSSATVTVDTKSLAIPLTIVVFNVTLPKPGDPKGSPLTVFNVGPQSYLNKSAELFGLKTDQQFRSQDASFFAFLSAYHLSPTSWGYGNPPSASGYVSSRAYFDDSSGMMVQQLQAGQFPDLWIPISNNRASAKSDAAGLSPFEPEKWCGYLGTVRQFWTLHGFLQGGAVPYIFPYDEPGDGQTSLLARQAAALHRCFPGAKMVVTATPHAAMSRLYDGKGTDDIDIWTIVDWRYYGTYTSPGQEKHGNRKHSFLVQIDKARSHGAKILAYTYSFSGFPSFNATEPLSDPRMFVLWTALEGIDGILYGQGLTTYGGKGNPLDQNIGGGGATVLIYPGNGTPIASARLDQIRSGLEDWEIFDIVRKRSGAAKVRSILGAHGLFSASASGVELACSIGCDLKGRYSESWPQWSHDGTTASKIAAARLDALKAASS
jgi:hypothetical protein